MVEGCCLIKQRVVFAKAAGVVVQSSEENCWLLLKQRAELRIPLLSGEYFLVLLSSPVRTLNFWQSDRDTG